MKNKESERTYLIGIEVLNKAGDIRGMLDQSLFAEENLLIANHKANALSVFLNVSSRHFLGGLQIRLSLWEFRSRSIVCTVI